MQLLHHIVSWDNWEEIIKNKKIIDAKNKLKFVNYYIKQYNVYSSLIIMSYYN